MVCEGTSTRVSTVSGYGFASAISPCSTSTLDGGVPAITPICLPLSRWVLQRLDAIQSVARLEHQRIGGVVIRVGGLHQVVADRTPMTTSQRKALSVLRTKPMTCG